MSLFVLLRQASHIQAAKAQLREFLLTQAQSPRSGGVTGDATEAALRALDAVFSRDAASRQQQLEEGERVLEQRLAALEAKEVTSSTLPKACAQSRYPHCPWTTQRISSCHVNVSFLLGSHVCVVVREAGRCSFPSRCHRGRAAAV